jgi:hypothetical protein
VKHGNDSGAAIVCRHVAKLGKPILFSARDEPTTPEDSGWQFLCNSGATEDETAAEVWAVSEVVDHEPTLAEFVESPVGTQLIRDNPDSPWRMA